ncbi:hypothetical protein CFT13S00388_09830, partial [Campylobacter fetus subsp. testudinum]|uniref:hypothetical protein n=1 Tax=Campylobacter fetus TaxID=196 RepID=UPI0008281FF1
WQNDTGKESASFTKRDESSINDENNITNEQNGANRDSGLDGYSKYRRDKQDNQITDIARCNKTGNQTQEKSMDKSCQSRISGDINDTQDKENMGEIRRGVLFDSQ